MLPVTRVLAGYVTDYGVPEERIAVIPNGINKAHFDTAPTPDEAKAQLGLQGRLVLGFHRFRPRLARRRTTSSTGWPRGMHRKTSSCSS